MKYVFLIFIVITAFNCSPKLSPDSGWGSQQWVVVEMKGVPVQQSGSRRDAHISFDIATKRFSGNGGCNQINGNYTLDKKEIKFTEVLSTKRELRVMIIFSYILIFMMKLENFIHNPGGYTIV